MNWSWLLPDRTGIPVLMYHKVWPGVSDKLTITPGQLKLHLHFLKQQGYTAISLQDFFAVLNGLHISAPKPLLLTFDDGYTNNAEYAYPLLKEMGWKATFFIIAGLLDGTYPNGAGADEKMTADALRLLDPSVIQLALHGYQHEHFGKLTPAEITDVMMKSMQCFEQQQLPYSKVLAYPYGGRPEDAATLNAMKSWMHDNGVIGAFRIGNQPQPTPPADIYELKRIDILGTDSIEDLAIKLKKGKLKPF